MAKAEKQNVAVDDKAAEKAAAKAEKAAEKAAPVPAPAKPWVCVREIREDARTWVAGEEYKGDQVAHLSKRNAIVQK